MRTLTKMLLVSSGAAAVGFTPGLARAQADTHLRLPNVLLLVDTSGSMEYLVPPNPSDPTGTAPMLPGDANAPGSTCTGVSNQTSVMNRWATLATVLTGTIPQSAFSCENLDRGSPSFQTEYSYAGYTPYDFHFYLPFHRIYSNNCTVGAGYVPSNWNWWSWPSQPFTFHDRMGNPCAWSGQAADGLLDTFAGRMRFGLMTFDVLPDNGTGAVLGASPAAVAADSARTGNWSYFHDWTASMAGAKTGFPTGCVNPASAEVGARNQAAPPWEGRLIPFGDPASDANVATTNNNIQLEILAMRPYGGTPLAGMMDDAHEFLFHDTTTDPNTGHTFGPSDDLYWQGGCRKTYIIVLSDGAPNTDLAGQCDPNTTGSCPYLPPDQIAHNLRTAAPPNQSVLTYVIGFAASNPTALSQLASPPNPLSCENLNVTTDCGPSSPAGLKACCALQKIAVQGGTGHAYFADNVTALKQQLSIILAQIGSGSTARTWPVYFPANSVAQGSNFAGNLAASYQFGSSFNVTTGTSPTGVPTGGGLWSGNLVRQRYTCSSSQVPTQQTVVASLNDDFAANVNMTDSSHPRRFLTVIGATGPDGVSVYSDRTIRANVGSTLDGFGSYAPSASASTALQTASAFPSSMGSYPAAFGITTSQPSCVSSFATTDAAACTQNIVNWEIGGNNTLPSTVPAASRDPSNCPTGQTCSKFGAIYHSTPTVVGPPSEALRDDAYVTYAATPAIATQPTMLYTATVDGQLHAFKVAANDASDSFTTDRAANNELWSFFPPRVLQHLLPNYNSQTILLDGSPVIADVPGQASPLTQLPVLSRTATTPQVGWRRILVGGGGQAGGFYYALDITSPTAPLFLWQLSSDGYGNPMFGAQTPTPAIASIALNIGGTRTQIPVAILSGGTGTMMACGVTVPPTSPVLTASASAAVPNDVNNPNNPASVGNTLAAQAIPLHCWDNTLKGTQSSGNSLTIVRLDTGEVLAHFIGQNYTGAPAPVGGGATNGSDDGSKVSNGFNNVIQAPFVAPITGVPVAYPGQTGQVADRIYVGDADGLLWRVDVSDPNKANWKVKVAWDAYMLSGDTNAVREPVQLPPVISRDAVGNSVLLFATSDQDTFTAQPTSTRVWSLTETPLNLNVSQNWWIKFPANGRRITGPLTLFNSVAYFATFMPQAGSVCSDGYGSVWGVDYRRPDSGNKPYPLAQFPVAGGGTTMYQDGSAGTVIFGLSVAATPSCNKAQTSTDPYFGTHAIPQNVTDTSYQVLMPTGGGMGLATSSIVKNNINKNNSGIPGSQTITISSPGQATKIDSWASIVE